MYASAGSRPDTTSQRGSSASCSAGCHSAHTCTCAHSGRLLNRSSWTCDHAIPVVFQSADDGGGTGVGYQSACSWKTGLAAVGSAVGTDMWCGFKSVSTSKNVSR